MKSLVICLIGLFSLNAMAVGKVGYVEKLAKKERKKLWRAGYQNVETDVVFMSKEILDKEITNENQNRYEQSLSSNEKSAIYVCFHQKQCDVYKINVTGSYHSGWGNYLLFVLINNDLSYDLIQQAIYSE